MPANQVSRPNEILGCGSKRIPLKLLKVKRKVVFILPTGDIYGPREEVEAMMKLTVFLINPLAYEEGCVGLTLVRRPTDSGSSSEIDGDEYGVVVVASAIRPCLKIKPGNAKMIKIDKNEY
ncbi:hypothetical protein MKW98_025937 [Papaver atlanticum]|uniref:Uncharacterized protein n=1 Tax=Papaver atlanticum TaxID=357466 RepID=A0AAD4SJZ9_9MAGN|nr:hypothetical protein MKW98_025937 [Papaver atlanticum]